jgi:hypothetical protein
MMMMMMMMKPKNKNESMLGELRVYVKVVDQKRHFVGPRGG